MWQATDLYTRVWCVCELMYAHSLGFFDKDGILSAAVTGSDKYREATSSVLDAKSSNIDDKAKILGMLLTKHDFTVIDDLVGKLRAKKIDNEYIQKPITLALVL